MTPRQKRTAWAAVVLFLAIGARKGRRRLRCWARGHRDVQRIYLGLHRCRECGRKGTDLSDFGPAEDAFIYDRKGL